MTARWILAALFAAVLFGGCGGDRGGELRIYTSVTQATVDAVVEGFTEEHPGVEVEVFRAPTGELVARLAAEEREGGIQADILWLTDPLSMQQYDAQGLLAEWEPVGAEVLPAEIVGDSFWGTRILSMVMVASTDVDPPETWRDLADSRFAGRVAFPDPGFAGSSFAVLGYFSTADEYGMDFYRDLAANGAVQVNAPGEVVTGVAEGRFDAGITLRFSAANAVAAGSPIEIVWPESGAVALYSPIAVTTVADDRATAEAFVEYVLTLEAQQRIADTGWQPVRSEVAWETDGPQVIVDWSVLFDRQQELLDEYRSIFGG